MVFIQAYKKIAKDAGFELKDFPVKVRLTRLDKRKIRNRLRAWLVNLGCYYFLPRSKLRDLVQKRKRVKTFLCETKNIERFELQSDWFNREIERKRKIRFDGGRLYFKFRQSVELL